MKKIITCFLFIALIFNCEENNAEDCAAVTCLANVSEAYFVLLDSTGKNALSEDFYTAEQITIKDSENKEVNFLIQDLLDTTLLELQGNNWDIGTRAYYINIDNNINFMVSIDLERTAGNSCCSNTLFIKNIEATSITSDFDTNTTICTITIP